MDLHEKAVFELALCVTQKASADQTCAPTTAFVLESPNRFERAVFLQGIVPAADHGQPVDELKARGILLDGTTEGGQPRLLLQIFAEAQVGPVFFEFIQRKGDEGFGEGNFKALFESMERDQVRRGVLNVEDAKTVSEPAE